MTVFVLPIEPLEERYTSVWYSWLPETFREHIGPVEVIDGEPLTPYVKVGAFLDINSTLHYKASQLQKVAKLFNDGTVKSGDLFFIADIEFWGMESIRYLARLQGIDIGIAGFLHAASYTRGDFMAPMSDIGTHVEPAWIAACDVVFVGSYYHRQQVIRHRLVSRDSNLTRKIVVTGNPWRTTEAINLVGGLNLNAGRPIDVLFPHRPDLEKRPGDFAEWIAHYINECGPLKVAFTTGRPEYRTTNDADGLRKIHQLREAHGAEIHTNCDRRTFYSLLRNSKVVVSTAIEENFGYAMVEGMAQGALPLMPKDFSYPHLVDGRETFLYAPGDINSFNSTLHRLLNPDIDHERYWVVNNARRFDNAEMNMVRELKKLCSTIQS